MLRQSGLLVRAIADGGREPAVLAHEPKRVGVADYATGALARLVADSGIEVTGAQVGATDPSAAFLGLGPGGRCRPLPGGPARRRRGGRGNRAAVRPPALAGLAAGRRPGGPLVSSQGARCRYRP